MERPKRKSYGCFTYYERYAQEMDKYTDNLKAENERSREALKKSLAWLITLANSGMKYRTLDKDIEIVKKALDENAHQD